jgi:hypothetical protein
LNPDRLVASTGVRIAGAVLAAACMLSVRSLRGLPPSAARSAVTALAWLTGLCAFLCAVHASRRGFELWTAFAARLHTTMTTAVFGACYLLLVPAFALIVRFLDPLRLRASSDLRSYWIPKRRVEIDREYLRRLG